MSERDESPSILGEVLSTLFDLIILAVIAGMLVAKYLEALSRYLAPAIVVSLAYLTWKHLLRRSRVQEMFSKAVHRSRMAYFYVFVACGLLGCIYLFAANRAIVKLDRMEKLAKSQGGEQAGEVKTEQANPKHTDSQQTEVTQTHSTPIVTDRRTKPTPPKAASVLISDISLSGQIKSGGKLTTNYLLKTDSAVPFEIAISSYAAFGKVFSDIDQEKTVTQELMAVIQNNESKDAEINYHTIDSSLTRTLSIDSLPIPEDMVEALQSGDMAAYFVFDIRDAKTKSHIAHMCTYSNGKVSNIECVLMPPQSNSYTPKREPQ